MRLKVLAAALVIFSASGLAVRAQSRAVVSVSVAAMRSEASFSSEMVSQALLGTPVHVLDSASWYKIETPDGYTGWVHYSVIKTMSAETLHEWNAAPKVVVTSLTGIVRDAPSGGGASVSDVVAGDRLRLLGREGFWWHVGFPDGRTGWLARSDAKELSEWRRGLSRDPAAIIATAKSMNGFPYLWAGMSPKGMDCSGFVRTVLFMHDIIIPRDASPQSKKGKRIDDTSLLEPGDFLFFGRRTASGEKVGHVGIYIGDHRFIHCLGMVKIASMDPSAPDYDAYNTGRYLFASRILPYIGTDPELCTTETNIFYNE